MFILDSRSIIGRLVLASIMLPFGFSNARSQSAPFQQKENIQGRISAFSKCLQTRSARCLADSISIHGVIVGVDGPRITRKSLAEKLLVDRKMQCLFWATHCDSSSNCSVFDETANLETMSIGEPRVHGKYWQVDVESKPSEACMAGLPLVFQLEDGYWKLVAIPYT